MPVFWLDEHEMAFPHPSLAEPGGLLAVGGDLSPDRLVLAYRNGIFPWFEDEGSFYWYAPDPRFVLVPQELRVHKSMRSVFNQHKFMYTLDTDFDAVIRACSEASRGGQNGSWISPAFIEGYTRLYDAGIAHSVEVWQGDKLVGGLYGLSLGRIFYGESMFTRVPNASKAGFITLVRALEKAGFWLVDCQQQTQHLQSLGARSISRELFQEYLLKNAYEPSLIGRWILQDDMIAVRQADTPAS
ncbi:MAG: leucyl/phenylalanyl-tRNA--protein transferase [Bacteroidetes bacterium]|nr:MAG: leucyl/phenylalanyl-tRNA--protein transferase [Bacteroidota bacterium]